MIYIKSFSDYEGFKSLFGLNEHGNGVSSRRNKILLALYKDKETWKKARKLGNYYPFTLTDMAQLKEWVKVNLNFSGTVQNFSYCLNLLGTNYYSNIYEIDSLGGICQDGDYRCIRYIKHEDGSHDGKVYKMKAGKFFAKIIEESNFGRCLPEQVKIWICEEFASAWQVAAKKECGGYTLHHGSEPEDFSGIYGDFDYVGDFHSCMMRAGNEGFYTDAVNATAAWLTNGNGDMVARCVIYNEVHESGSDKVWRLAERQYCTECDDTLKRVLILKLIDAGLIDGYKQIGAGCGDAKAFVDVNGQSLSRKNFYIDCKLENDDRLSYQDSFKWFDYSRQRADNYGSGENADLDTTSGYVNIKQGEWDDWHEEYCDEVVTVYYHGDSMYCNVDRLDDFRMVPTAYNDYYYYEDVVWDENRQEYILEEDARYCKYEDEYHYYEDCEMLANGDYALESDCVEIDGDYYLEDDDDVVLLANGDYALRENCVVIDNEFYLESDCVELPNGEYALMEDCVQCATCDEWILEDSCEYYSEITGKHYCCEDCQLEDEKRYREEHALVKCAV
jgi:hypothetical protein